MIAEGHGGAIVMISSISAHVGAPTQVAYCGTKGAISMLAKALGAVLGKHGIRVNAIEPGAIDTPMAAGLFEQPDVLKYYLERIALGRVGKPSEIASVVAMNVFGVVMTSLRLITSSSILMN